MHASRRPAGRPLPWRRGPRPWAPPSWGASGPNGRLRRGGHGVRARMGHPRPSSVTAMEAPAARLLPLLLLIWAWAPAPGRASAEAPPLINEDVKRTVDLSSHLAKVTAEVVLAHAGGSSSSRVASFLLALEPELEARLAYLGVQVSWARGHGPAGRTGARPRPGHVSPGRRRRRLGPWPAGAPRGGAAGARIRQGAGLRPVRSQMEQLPCFQVWNRLKPLLI